MLVEELGDVLGRGPGSILGVLARLEGEPKRDGNEPDGDEDDTGPNEAAEGHEGRGEGTA
jgi:hypothetical protein